MSTRVSESDSFEAIIYAQGIFPSGDESIKFFNKIWNLETSNCEIKTAPPRDCYSISGNPPKRYYSGPLKISGIENEVKKVVPLVKKIMKDFGVKELTEKQYKNLPHSKD